MGVISGHDLPCMRHLSAHTVTLQWTVPGCSDRYCHTRLWCLSLVLDMELEVLGDV